MVGMSDLGDFTDFDPDDEGDPPTDGGQETTTGTSDGASDGAVDDSTDAGQDTEAPTDTTADPETTATTAASGPQEGSDGFEAVEVSPAGVDSGLGVVSATEGLRISEDSQETELRAYVTVENRSPSG